MFIKFQINKIKKSVKTYEDNTIILNENNYDKRIFNKILKTLSKNINNVNEDLINVIEKSIDDDEIKKKFDKFLKE